MPSSVPAPHIWPYRHGQCERQCPSRSGRHQHLRRQQCKKLWINPMETLPVAPKTAKAAPVATALLPMEGVNTTVPHGPRTPEGLERSRKANLTHGFYSADSIERRRHFRKIMTDTPGKVLCSQFPKSDDNVTCWTIPPEVPQRVVTSQCHGNAELSADTSLHSVQPHPVREGVGSLLKFTQPSTSVPQPNHAEQRGRGGVQTDFHRPY
jgi:hypothetical protein